MPVGARKVPHLFIQMTEPLGQENQVLLVNVSTIYAGIYHDPSCVFHTGEHTAITHDSFVFYKHAKLETVQKLEEMHKDRTCIPQDSLSVEAFSRVVEGFKISPHAIPEMLRFLAEDENAE